MAPVANGVGSAHEPEYDFAYVSSYAPHGSGQGAPLGGDGHAFQPVAATHATQNGAHQGAPPGDSWVRLPRPQQTHAEHVPHPAPQYLIPMPVADGGAVPMTSISRLGVIPSPTISPRGSDASSTTSTRSAVSDVCDTSGAKNGRGRGGGSEAVRAKKRVSQRSATSDEDRPDEGAVDGRAPDQFKQRSAEIAAFYRAHRLTRQDVERWRETVADLQEALSSVWDGALLHIHGSFSTEFASRESDIDLDIVWPYTPPLVRPVDPAGLLQQLSVALQLKNYQVDAVLGARVPILKVHGPDGIRADIAYLNNYQDPASQLLRDYARCDPRVKPLVVVVKEWSRCRGVADAVIGGLNTFGVTLMLLQYLQITDPPVIPNFQDEMQRREFITKQHRQHVDDAHRQQGASQPQPIRLSESDSKLAVPASSQPRNRHRTSRSTGDLDTTELLTEEEQEGETSKRVLLTPQPQREKKVPSRPSQPSRSPSVSPRTPENDARPQQQQPQQSAFSLGDLLYGYFNLYSEDGIFDPKTMCISVRCGTIVARADAATRGPRDCLVIEDPFKVDNNVARNVQPHALRRLRAEFTRARDLLDSGGTLQQLLVTRRASE